MKQMRLFSLMMLFFFRATLCLEASTLHVVLVGDTLDRSIGPSVRSDLVQMQSLSRDIAQKANMELNLTVLKGTQVRPQRVFPILRELAVQPDDAILFYFSGHGYRTTNKGDDIWPMLYFSVVNRGSDFTDFQQILIDKSPRMLLAIADCCNNVLPDYEVPPAVTRGVLLKAKGFNSQEKANLQKLFAQSRGYFLVSSSIPGQYSWSLSDGGLFTLSFLEILQNEILENDTSWEYIFTKTIETVVVNTIDLGSGVQIPQFLAIPID